MNKSLVVWSNDTIIGELHAAQNRKPISFVFADTYFKNSQKQMRTISYGFPLGQKVISGETCERFFVNLLPDREEVRRRLAINVGAAGSDTFSLLEAIGKDCVGALQFLPRNRHPHRVKGGLVELDETQIEEDLATLVDVPLGARANDGFRISIAGAQLKTAYHRRGNKWFKPIGSTPTTHILKVPLGVLNGLYDLSNSCENEHFCMRYLHHAGLKVAQTEIHRFGNQKALVIERFDRRGSGSQIRRIAMEDMCQALGYAPEDKYEVQSGKKTGPSLIDIADFLRIHSLDSQDLFYLWKAQVHFWLLGATDGHAKNFSIFLEPGGCRLTPLYDVLSTEPLRRRGKIRKSEYRLAMAVGKRRWIVNQIEGKDFLHTAKDLKLNESICRDYLMELRKIATHSLQKTLSELPERFPNDLSESIINGISDRLKFAVETKYPGRR